MKNKKFEQWIRKQIDFYTPILDIGLWTIKIKNNEKENYLAISCNYPYLDAELSYAQKALTDWKKGKLKRDRLLHELCHIITDPLYVKAIERYSSKNEITDEREKLTDMIAAVITKLLK